LHEADRKRNAPSLSDRINVSGDPDNASFTGRQYGLQLTMDVVSCDIG
jgi:hypothetical protein